MMKMFDMAVVFKLIPAEARQTLIEALEEHRQERITVVKLIKTLQNLGGQDGERHTNP